MVLENLVSPPLPSSIWGLSLRQLDTIPKLADDGIASTPASRSVASRKNPPGFPAQAWKVGPFDSRPDQRTEPARLEKLPVSKVLGKTLDLLKRYLQCWEPFLWTEWTCSIPYRLYLPKLQLLLTSTGRLRLNRPFEWLPGLWGSDAPRISPTSYCVTLCLIWWEKYVRYSWKYGRYHYALETTRHITQHFLARCCNCSPGEKSYTTENGRCPDMNPCEKKNFLSAKTRKKIKREKGHCKKT